MFSIPSIAFIFVSIVVQISDISALPSNATIFNTGLDHVARAVLTDAILSTPKFVIYGDAYDGTIGPPAASAVKVKVICYSTQTQSFIIFYRDSTYCK